MLDRFIYWIRHPVVQYTLLVIFIKFVLISLIYIYFISDSILSVSALVPLDLKPSKDKPVKWFTFHDKSKTKVISLSAAHNLLEAFFNKVIKPLPAKAMVSFILKVQDLDADREGHNVRSFSNVQTFITNDKQFYSDIKKNLLNVIAFYIEKNSDHYESLEVSRIYFNYTTIDVSNKLNHPFILSLGSARCPYSKLIKDSAKPSDDWVELTKSVFYTSLTKAASASSLDIPDCSLPNTMDYENWGPSFNYLTDNSGYFNLKGLTYGFVISDDNYVVTVRDQESNTLLQWKDEAPRVPNSQFNFGTFTRTILYKTQEGELRPLFIYKYVESIQVNKKN